MEHENELMLLKHVPDNALKQFTKSFLDDIYFLTLEEIDFNNLLESYKCTGSVLKNLIDVLLRLGYRNKVPEQAFWEFVLDQKFGVSEWLTIRVNHNPGVVTPDLEYVFSYFNESGFRKLKQKQKNLGVVLEPVVKFKTAPITWSEAPLLLEKNHENFVEGRKFFIEVFRECHSTIIPDAKFVETSKELMKRKNIISDSEDYRDGVKKLFHPYSKAKLKAICIDEILHNEEELFYKLKEDSGSKLIKKIGETQRKRSELIQKIQKELQRLLEMNQEIQKRRRTPNFWKNMDSGCQLTPRDQSTGMSSDRSFSIIDGPSESNFDESSVKLGSWIDAMDSDNLVDESESLTEVSSENQESAIEDHSDTPQIQIIQRKRDYESVSDESETDNRICHQDDVDDEVYQGQALDDGIHNLRELLDGDVQETEDFITFEDEKIPKLIKDDECPNITDYDLFVEESDNSRSDDFANDDDQKEECRNITEKSYNDRGEGEDNIHDSNDNSSDNDQSEDENNVDNSNDHDRSKERYDVDDTSNGYSTDFDDYDGEDDDYIDDENGGFNAVPDSDDGYKANLEDDDENEDDSFSSRKQAFQPSPVKCSSDLPDKTGTFSEKRQNLIKKNEVNPMDDILSLYSKEAKDESENQSEVDVLPIQLEKLIIVTEADRKKELENSLLRKKYKSVGLPPGAKTIDSSDEMNSNSRAEPQIEHLFGLRSKEIPKDEKLKHVDHLQRLAGTDKNPKHHLSTVIKGKNIIKSGGGTSASAAHGNNQVTAVVAAFQSTSNTEIEDEDFYGNESQASTSAKQMYQTPINVASPLGISKPTKRLPLAVDVPNQSLQTVRSSNFGRAPPNITRFFPSPNPDANVQNVEQVKQPPNRFELIKRVDPLGRAPVNDRISMNEPILRVKSPNEGLHHGPGIVPVGCQVPRSFQQMDNIHQGSTGHYQNEYQSIGPEMMDQRQGLRLSNVPRNNNWQTNEDNRYTPVTEEEDWRSVNGAELNQNNNFRDLGRQRQNYDFANHGYNLPNPPPMNQHVFSPHSVNQHVYNPPPVSQFETFYPMFSSGLPSTLSRFAAPTSLLPTRQILGPERIFEAMYKLIDTLFTSSVMGRVPLERVRQFLQLQDLPTDPSYVKNGNLHGWEEFCTYYQTYQFDVDQEIFYKV